MSESTAQSGPLVYPRPELRLADRIELRTPGRRVPKFDPDRIDGCGRPEMNRLQRSFYVREFQPAFLAGEPVDVEGQRGYALVMLHDLVDGRAEDPEAMQEVRRLATTYREADSIPNARAVFADTYYAVGDFAGGFRSQGYAVGLQEYLALTEHLVHPRVSAMSIPRWGSSYMTKKSYGNYFDVLVTLQQILDDFHDANGISIIEDFWLRITADMPIEDVARSIEHELVDWIDGAAVRHRLTEHRETENRGFHPLVFRGFPGLERRVEWPAPVPRSGPWLGLVYAKLRMLSRAAENAYRDGVGVPRVGEGLVSEMTLLQEIRSAFPDEQIVHQSRPGWLAPQSLDIHIPNRDVAIEYQGIQHTRPIERFGGEAAFAVQQERDARKRAACNAAGCTLIEVHPGYDLDEVVATVRAAIEKAGA